MSCQEKTSSKARPGRRVQVPQETRDEIVELCEFYGARKIGERVGLSRKVVRRVLMEAGFPPNRKLTGQSKLAPFIEHIAERVEKELTTTRILREIRNIGYQGGRTILAKHVHTLRVQLGLKAPVKVKRRFETRPGLESQLDWSPYTVIIAGQPTKIHALGTILANSRKLHYAVYRNERQSTLLEGIAIAGEYFDGFTLRLVIDNMATAVLGRIGPKREPIWNPRFLAFCKHYGFTPFPCKPRDPNRKGKKEKAFRLFFEDFLKGTEFASWEDLEYRLKIWLDHTDDVCNLRIHGTTGLIPNEAYLAERDLLIRLPHERFPVFKEVVSLVDDDATISVDGIRYTVPDVLARRAAPVRKYAEHFEVLDPHGRVAYSRRYIDRSIDKRRLVIDETCYSKRPRRSGDCSDGQRLDEAFVRRFPSLRPLVEGLKLKFKALANIHVRELLRLSSTYGEEAFVEAATRAQEHHRFKSQTVALILEKEHPLPPEDLSTPLGGLGAIVLGEVDEPSLDEGFGELDTAPETPFKKEEDGDGEM